MIQMKCGQCDKLLKVAGSMVGKRVKCPGCSSVLVVPGRPKSEREALADTPESVPTVRTRNMKVAGVIGVVLIICGIGGWLWLKDKPSLTSGGQPAPNASVGPGASPVGLTKATKDPVPLPSEQMTLTLKDGNACPLVATKLAEPYVVRYRAEGYDYDLSQITDVLDALASSVGRQPALYKSLMDDGMQEKMQALNEKTGGRVFGTHLKDTPFPSSTEWQSLICYWVDLEHESKTYRLVIGKDIVEGEVTPPSTTTFVKKGDRWLQTRDLDGTGIGYQFAFDSYEDLQDSCGTPPQAD